MTERNTFFQLRLDPQHAPHALVARRGTVVELFMPSLGWTPLPLDPERLEDRDVAVPTTRDEADLLADNGFGPSLSLGEFALLDCDLAEDDMAA